MSRFFRGFVAGFFLAAFGYSLTTGAAETIQLSDRPSLSPNGKLLAFQWAGDIWTVATSGGTASRLTHLEAVEADPKISPDGKRIAFTSNRTGSYQVYVMDIDGGSTPRQLTFHSEGSRVAGWFPDGQSLLIRGARDDYWHHAERFFRISASERSAEELIFDALASEPSISPSGTKLLFNREGERWWRKGYQGSRAAQIWQYDLTSGSFDLVVRKQSESRTPIWRGKDEMSFIYVSGAGGTFNLYERKVDSENETQLTDYDDDSVLRPTASADGSTIVYRHLFDLYRITKKQPAPHKIEITIDGDHGYEDRFRRTLTTATDVSFSQDGLELAFISGGDLWVMDTILKEPVQITDSVEFERDVAFSPDGKSILYVSDMGGQSDLWLATRKDDKRYWWQNKEFEQKKLTDDPAMETSARWSPQGDRISFVRSRGTLRVINVDGSDGHDVVKSWNRPDYDWSPDGKWLVYSLSNNEFNRDIFVTPLDGSREPYNLSRHPDNEASPRWSPDGKMIAFVGRREADQVDIYFVHLQADENEISARDLRMKAALNRLGKARKETPGTAEKKPGSPKKPLVNVSIDFDGIHERIRRVAIKDTSESGLFWSPDSKKLAFQATLGGKNGTYTISPPTDLTPALLTTTVGSHAKWLAAGNVIVWLVSGKPASHTSTGTAASFAFTVRQELTHSARYVAAFDDSWRAMRDNFYDGKLNNRNWDATRRKYQAAAAACKSPAMLADVIHLMLGELNGSHLGFSYQTTTNERTASSPAWRETTAHLGVRFEPEFRGPGLKIRDVLPQSPAEKVKSRLHTGETILEINGTPVDSAFDMTSVLNAILPADFTLQVKGIDDQEREVVIRPWTFSSARTSLYEKWMDGNQKAVSDASAGRLGYLHIRGMNKSSFYRFEQELFEIGAGKDGIVIDVRENGGGSTADHLLTILTQPRHAITVPRGGGPGYPQDRMVYATWRKPIIVLCNQNSFSNAEIFSHAIKTLKRGKLIGVPTAGGVISTGATRITDIGTLRMPFRGWYVLGTGEDMELNGAVPHQIIWPKPGEMPAGVDKQLKRAIKVLQADVKRWQKTAQPKLKNASER
jgi:tricorn protease